MILPRGCIPSTISKSNDLQKKKHTHIFAQDVALPDQTLADHNT